MSRKPVIFLNIEYKTQLEFEKYVKKIIYEDIGICNDIKNTYPKEYYILIKILERHPEFKTKTKNMSNIKITHDKLNKKALKTIIINNDGKNIDISWKCAITGKSKSKKYDLTSALRSSIDTQIHQFRKDHINDYCQICGSTEKLQVDHNDTKNSSFAELVLNFISYIKKNTDIEIPDKFGELNDDTHRRGFLEEDTAFKNKWLKYHKEHASLRILCRTCNIRRPKLKNKFVL